MKTNKDQDFYQELDQYRHKSGCDGVSMLVIALVVLAVGAYLLLRYLGIL